MTNQNYDLFSSVHQEIPGCLVLNEEKIRDFKAFIDLELYYASKKLKLYPKHNRWTKRVKNLDNAAEFIRLAIKDKVYTVKQFCHYLETLFDQARDNDTYSYLEFAEYVHNINATYELIREHKDEWYPYSQLMED